ncbi:MAG TPA: hypothetical protein GXX51_04710 [Firmicutes bacterium]|nr:hypothetical protein [Bacillota bacterium]
MSITETKGVLLVTLSLNDGDHPGSPSPPTIGQIMELAREKAGEVINREYIKDVLVSVNPNNTVTLAIVV